MAPAKFIIGEEFRLEETRHVEFKEIKGMNPVASIVNTADEYAVAFLNSDGGTLYWGVRDSDHVIVGVTLDPRERDSVRKGVFEKLYSIQPQIDPTEFHLSFHETTGAPIRANSFIVQLSVPNPACCEPFYTGSHQVFVRVDGAKRKLTGPQLTSWIQRRLRGSSSGARDESKEVKTSWELLSAAEKEVRRGNFDATAEVLTKILQRYPRSHEANTVVSLVRIARADGRHAYHGNVTSCTVADARSINASVAAMDAIAKGYNSADADKKRAVDTIFGPGTFSNPNLSLDGVLNCLIQLSAARDKALG